MVFKNIIVLFVYVLNFSVVNVSSNQDKTCGKLNVVLFFAKSACSLPKEPSGMKALEMHEVATVKTSFPGTHNFGQGTGSCPSCKDLLRESLTSLVHFCENALGMKTAVTSVSKPKITDDISNSEPETPPEIRERHFSQDTAQDFFQVEPNKKDSGPFLQQQSLRKPEVVNLRDVITSPEHTEVFKIRVKRQLPELEHEQRGQIVDVPLEKENSKHPWDVLDIMSHIRFSFFGKLFEDEGKNKLSEEENKIAEDLTQSKEDPGLFATVKTTLSTLQENPEEPLFMTIFGGHLSEISNCDSPLIQTIKHVIENTDPKNTLIVLTGSCPDYEGDGGHHYHEFGREHDFDQHVHRRNHEHRHKGRHKGKRNGENEQNVVHIGGNGYGEHHENATIPVFARGPEYTKLCQCSLLFDVPVVVKSILEQMSPTFEGESRPKRSVFGDIRMNKDNYKNSAVEKYQTAIFEFCIFLLFMI